MLEKLFAKLGFIKVPSARGRFVYGCYAGFWNRSCPRPFDNDHDQCGELEMSNHPKPAVIFGNVLKYGTADENVMSGFHLQFAARSNSSRVNSWGFHLLLSPFFS